VARAGTRNLTPLWPEDEGIKYYGPGVGVVLELDVEGRRHPGRSRAVRRALTHYGGTTRSPYSEPASSPFTILPPGVTFTSSRFFSAVTSRAS